MTNYIIKMKQSNTDVYKFDFVAVTETETIEGCYNYEHEDIIYTTPAENAELTQDIECIAYDILVSQCLAGLCRNGRISNYLEIKECNCC